MGLSRRAALGALATAPLAAGALTRLGAGPAAAAVAPTGQQAPGYYRMKVGDYEITLIHDGFATRPKPTEGFVRNAKPEEVASALQDVFLPTEALRIPFTFTAARPTWRRPGSTPPRSTGW